RAAMLATLTAFEILVVVLCGGLIAALFGYAGGAGARIRDRMRLTELEDAFAGLGTVVNRYRGAQGQAVKQENARKLSKVEAEAEELARKLARGRGIGPPVLAEQ